MMPRTHRLRRPAALLLAVLLLPLLGGIAQALEASDPHHPCAAAARAPAEPVRLPAAESPCGAVVQLSCCNETASVSSAGEDVPAAPRATLGFLVATPLSPACVAFSGATASARAPSARAAPPAFLDTIVLRN